MSLSVPRSWVSRTLLAALLLLTAPPLVFGVAPAPAYPFLAALRRQCVSDDKLHGVLIRFQAGKTVGGAGLCSRGSSTTMKS